MHIATRSEVEQREYTEEERDAARQKGLAVFLFGALPSVWAQDQLIWSKERKPDEPKGKKKRRRRATATECMSRQSPAQPRAASKSPRCSFVHVPGEVGGPRALASTLDAAPFDRLSRRSMC